MFLMQNYIEIKEILRLVIEGLVQEGCNWDF